MKKEDFIKGKWYISSEWNEFIAAKFDGFNWDDDFTFSEIIGKKLLNHRYNNNSYTNTDKQRWSTFKEVSIAEIARYLPKDHPDLPNNNEFPKTGYCSGSEIDIATIANYLHNTLNKKIIGSNTLADAKCVVWTETCYYYMSVKQSTTYSCRPTDYILNTINNKTKTNYGNIKQNDNVPTTTSEVRKSTFTGTITIRRGRQQITTGSRPNGNQACVNTGRSRFNTVKIRKNIVKRENY